MFHLGLVAQTNFEPDTDKCEAMQLLLNCALQRNANTKKAIEALSYWIMKLRGELQSELYYTIKNTIENKVARLNDLHGEVYFLQAILAILDYGLAYPETLTLLEMSKQRGHSGAAYILARLYGMETKELRALVNRRVPMKLEGQEYARNNIHSICLHDEKKAEACLSQAYNAGSVLAHFQASASWLSTSLATKENVILALKEVQALVQQNNYLAALHRLNLYLNSHRVHKAQILYEAGYDITQIKQDIAVLLCSDDFISYDTVIKVMLVTPELKNYNLISCYIRHMLKDELIDTKEQRQYIQNRAKRLLLNVREHEPENLAAQYHLIIALIEKSRYSYVYDVIRQQFRDDDARLKQPASSWVDLLIEVANDKLLDDNRSGYTWNVDKRNIRISDESEIETHRDVHDVWEDLYRYADEKNKFRTAHYLQLAQALRKIKFSETIKHSRIYKRVANHARYSRLTPPQSDEEARYYLLEAEHILYKTKYQSKINFALKLLEVIPPKFATSALANQLLADLYYDAALRTKADMETAFQAAARYHHNAIESFTQHASQQDANYQRAGAIHMQVYQSRKTNADYTHLRNIADQKVENQSTNKGQPICLSLIIKLLHQLTSALYYLLSFFNCAITIKQQQPQHTYSSNFFSESRMKQVLETASSKTAAPAA